MDFYYCRRNRFNVPEIEKVLKSKTLELSPIVMDDLHGFRILGKPGVLNMSSNMVTSFIEYAYNFNEVGGGINTSESKEFHNVMWC